MITLLEEYETQRKLLKIRFYPCYIYNMKQALPGKLAKLITNYISLVLDEKHMQNFML